MRVKIRNIAKISNAEIEFNGITVIAGKNNTGKSTIGKVLYAYFHSFYRIDRKMEMMRKKKFFMIFDEFLSKEMFRIRSKEKYSNKEIDYMYELLYMLKREYRNIMDRNFYDKLEYEEIEKATKNLLKKYSIEDSGWIKKLYKKATEEAYSVDEKTIITKIVEDCFINTFDGQICNFNKSTDSKIEFIIKDKLSSISFIDNKITEMKQAIVIEHDAILIDNPLIVEDVTKYNYRNLQNNDYRDDLTGKLSGIRRIKETTIDSIKASKKMQDIINQIDEVVKGNLIFEGGMLQLKEKDNVKATNISNVSLGLKSFVLLKNLIENEVVKDNDFVILDEPEVHLHPEWQIRYAEIIVLLQKTYNLNFLITTHSRDFFEAIELFSKKYSLNHKCKFYVSMEENSGVKFLDLKDDPTEIYRQLITASSLLDDLRFELEDEQDA